MADRAHSTSRRALLAGLGATTVMYLPAYANGVHPDAELLALEAPIAALAATADGLSPELRRLDAAAEAAAAPRPRSDAPEWPAFVDRHNAAMQALGYDTVHTAWERADRALLKAIREIERIPARTFDGLRMKARMCEHGDDDLVQSIVGDLIAIDVAMRA